MNSRKIIIGLILIFAGCSTYEVQPIKEFPKLENKFSIGIPDVRPRQFYPKSMYDIGQDGWVLLKVDIDPNGNADNVRVVDFSPYRAFIPQAIKHVVDTKYPSHSEVDRPAVVVDHMLLVKFNVHKVPQNAKR